MLKRLVLALALARALLASAQADTLTAGQTKTTALADWYANIYYTVEGTCQVVITPDRRSPVNSLLTNAA